MVVALGRLAALDIGGILGISGAIKRGKGFSPIVGLRMRLYRIGLASLNRRSSGMLFAPRKCRNSLR